MQILFLLNELQFEASSDRFVLQRVVILDVVNKLFQQITAIVDLEESCVGMLVWVDTSDTVMVMAITESIVMVSVGTVLTRLWIEKVASRRLHLLVELKHLNDVSLLAVTCSLLVLIIWTSTALLVSEQVVLGLIRIYWHIIVSLFFVAAGNTILIDASKRGCLVTRLHFVLGIGHKHLNSFEVLSASSDPLHELQILAFHVLMTLSQFIVLERQFEDFLAGTSFCLCRLLPVTLIHIETSFHLCCLWCHTSIVLMDCLNVFLVSLWFLFLVGPQVLYLCLVFFFPRAESAYLWIQILDFCGLPLRCMALLLQLSFQRFFFLPETTF